MDLGDHELLRFFLERDPENRSARRFDLAGGGGNDADLGAPAGLAGRPVGHHPVAALRVRGVGSQRDRDQAGGVDLEKRDVPRGIFRQLDRPFVDLVADGDAEALEVAEFAGLGQDVAVGGNHRAVDDLLAAALDHGAAGLQHAADGLEGGMDGGTGRAVGRLEGLGGREHAGGGQQQKGG